MDLNVATAQDTGCVVPVARKDRKHVAGTWLSVVAHLHLEVDWRRAVDGRHANYLCTIAAQRHRCNGGTLDCAILRVILVSEIATRRSIVPSSCG